MLRISEQSSVGFAKRRYAPADYYDAGLGIVGSWGGKGAFRLGLDGIVGTLGFCRLCENQNPRIGGAVTVRTRAKRRVGYTFRFSVPKSVSLLYAVSGDKAILSAFRGAVYESMCEMEGELKTRVRRGGQNTERPTGNMVWAEFIHLTSWPVAGIWDPQLQAYLFVFNMTWDEQEDRWKAGYFRDIKGDAPYFQAAFRVRLANKLHDLGLTLERRGDDFEVSGIPSDVLERFSQRTELIQRVAWERDITDPVRKRELGPRTKGRRGKLFGLDALRREWKARLSRSERRLFLRKEWKARLSRSARQLFLPVCRNKRRVATEVNGEAQAVDAAIQQCFMREAEVLERDLLTEALKCGIGAVTVEGVAREVANRLFVRRDVGGHTMLTLPCK
jgi:conjugative relaxase-like TrwC/TraI family protein